MTRLLSRPWYARTYFDALNRLRIWLASLQNDHSKTVRFHLTPMDLREAPSESLTGLIVPTIAAGAIAGAAIYASTEGMAEGIPASPQGNESIYSGVLVGPALPMDPPLADFDVSVPASDNGEASDEDSAAPDSGTPFAEIEDDGFSMSAGETGEGPDDGGTGGSLTETGSGSSSPVGNGETGGGSPSSSPNDGSPGGSGSVLPTGAGFGLPGGLAGGAPNTGTVSTPVPPVVANPWADSPGVFGGRPATAVSTRTEANAPLRFVANAGQWDESVKYAASGSGYRVWVTGGETVLALQRPNVPANANGDVDYQNIRFSWTGIDPDAPFVAERRLGSVTNYLVGSDPSQWKTGLAEYARVRQVGAGPGYDLVYYGTERDKLQFDVAVRPHGDVANVSFEVHGADSIQLNVDGSLAIGTAVGTLTHSAPVTYQRTAGGGQTPVESRFVLLGDNKIGFAVGEYDHSKELIIDPVVDFGTAFGGDGTDGAQAITTDASGNVFLGGATNSSSFGNALPFSDQSTAFISKVSPTGQLLWTTNFGGEYSFSYPDGVRGIALDPGGDIYVAGNAEGSGFPTTAGAFQTSRGGTDAFVAKFSGDGSTLLASTVFGGSDADSATGLAIDSYGGVVVVGNTRSTDLPTASAAQSALIGTSAGFLARFDAGLGSLAYATYLNGDVNVGSQSASGIAISAGTTYVVGDQDGVSSSNPQAFIKQFDSSGQFVAESILDGSGADVATGVAVGPDGAVFVVGTTHSTDLPGAFGSLQGSSDAFLARYGSIGGAPAFVRYLGGVADESARSVDVDFQGRAAVVGQTTSSRLDGGYATNSPSGFFAWLSLDGTQVLDQMLFGAETEGAAVTIGNDDAVFAAGKSGTDVYLVKIWPGLEPVTVSSLETESGAVVAYGVPSNASVFRASGTASAFGTVQVALRNQNSWSMAILGTATADGNGAWSFLFASPQQDGDYGIEARPMVQGNALDLASAWSWTIDHTAPNVTVANQGMSGTAMVFAVSASDSNALSSTVYLDVDTNNDGGYDGPGEIGFASAETSGGNAVFELWNLPVAGRVRARAYDAAGNEGISDGVSFSATTNPPSTPSISYASGGQSLSVGGTASPHATLYLNLPWGTWSATADDAGNWSFAVSGLPEGGFSFSVYAEQGGQSSAPTDPRYAVIDTTAPGVSVDAPGVVYDSPHWFTVSASDSNSLGSAHLEIDADGDTSTEDWIEVATGSFGGSTATLPVTPLNGTWILRARATDAYGNVGYSPNYVVTTPSTSLAVSIDRFDDDTGESPFDRVTSDTTPTLGGSATSGATVTVYENDQPIGSTTADGSGRWSMTVGPLPDGAHSFVAKATSASSSFSAEAGLSAVIDTSPPVVSFGTFGNEGRTYTITVQVDDANLGSQTLYLDVDHGDDGSVNEWFSQGIGGSGTYSFTVTLPPGTHRLHSWIGNGYDVAGNLNGEGTTTTLSVPLGPTTLQVGVTGNVATFSGTAEPGSTISVVIGGSIYGATADGMGYWTTVSGAIPDGVYAVIAFATLGCLSSEPCQVDGVVFDTTAPTVSVDAPPEVHDNPHWFTVTASDANSLATAHLEIDADGNLETEDWIEVASGSIGGGTATLPIGTPPGTWILRARVTDAYSNIGYSPNYIITTPETSLSITIDQFDDDTGESMVDRITFDNTPTVGGTATSGATVTLYENEQVIGSAAVDGAGRWSIPVAALPDGAHTFVAKATSSSSSFTAETTVTAVIDTTPPTVAFTAIGTEGRTYTFTVQVDDANLGPQTLFFDVDLGNDGSVDESQSVAIGGPGTYNFTATLTAGTHRLNSWLSTGYDIAGNPSSSTSTVIEVPVGPTGITGFSEDTGISGSDRLTRNLNTIYGFAEPGSYVTITATHATTGETRTYSTTASVMHGGWTYDLGSEFASSSDGEWSFVATASIGEVSSGTSNVLEVTVDTIPPDVQLVPATEARGRWDSIRFTATDTYGVAPIELSLDVDRDGDGQFTGFREEDFARGVMSPDGTVVFKIDTIPLPIGTFLVRTKAMDKAGNWSEYATAQLTVEGTAAPPVITSMSYDSGTSAVDRLTNDSSPTLYGFSEPGSLVKLYYRDEFSSDWTPAGEAPADGWSGAWEINVDFLLDGRYQFAAEATIAYQTTEGSLEATSPKSSPFEIIVDTVPPTGITIDVRDRTTSRSPVITVDASDAYGFDPQSYLDFDIDQSDTFDPWEPHASAVSVQNGRYVFRGYSPLPTGVIGVRAHVTDRAGNSSVSSIRTFTIDTEKASLSGTVYSDNNDDGVRNTGERGVGQVELTLYGTVDGEMVGPFTTTTDAGGRYTFSGLEAGTYRVHRSPLEDFLDGAAAEGDHDGVVEDETTIGEIALSGGDEAKDYQFGVVPIEPVRLSDTQITASPFSAVVGVAPPPEEPFVLATFTDADLDRTSDDYEAFALWGDPMSTPVDPATRALTITGGNGNFRILANPRFVEAGVYPVNIEIKAIYPGEDSEGESAEGSGGSGSSGSGTPPEPSPAIVHSYFTNITVTAQPGPLELVNMIPFTIPEDTVNGVEDWQLVYAGNVPDEDLENYKAIIEWGDGSWEEREVMKNTAPSVPGVRINVGGHQYAAPGVYRIRATITDAGFLVPTEGVDVTVTGVDAFDIRLAPVPFTAKEGIGAAPALLGTFSPPSLNGVPLDGIIGVEARVDWGDGTDDLAVVGTGGISAPAHKYQQVGTYPVRVDLVFTQLLENDETVEIATSRFTTANVEDDRIATAPNGVTVAEGNSLQQFFPAGFTNGYELEPNSDYKATIRWGDGTSSTGRVTGSGLVHWIDATHTFSEAGWYTATVTLWEERGFEYWSTQTAIRVVPAMEQRATTGGTAGFVYVPDPNGSASAEVTFEEDMDPVGATVVPPIEGNDWREILVPGYTYEFSGGYPQEITVNVGASSGGLGSSVPVADAALTGGGVLGVGGLALQTVGTGLLARLTNPAATAYQTYSATIDWGDGVVEEGSVTVVDSGNPDDAERNIARQLEVYSAGHIYLEEGTYQVTVVVGDLVQVGTAVIVPPADGTVKAYQRRNELDNDSWHAGGADGEVSTNTGAVRLSHELDFDLSPGTDVGWNPHLVYNSDTVDPRPVIESKFYLPRPARSAAKVKATLEWNGVWQEPRFFNPPSDAGAEWVIALRPDSPVVGTGLYDWKLKIEACTAEGALLSFGVDVDNQPVYAMNEDGTAQVVDHGGSGFGAGWALDTQWEIVPEVDDDDSAMIVYGTGESRLFKQTEFGFVPPAEDSGTLTYSNGQYVYRSDNGIVRRFDGSGRQLEIEDRHGFKTRFHYVESTRQLASIETIDGNTVQFLAGAHGLTIRQSGNRDVELKLTAGKLTEISNGGYTRGFGYQGKFVTSDQRTSSSTTLDQSSTFAFDDNAKLYTGYTLGGLTTYRLQSVVDRGLRGPAVEQTDKEWAALTGRWIDPRGLNSPGQSDPNVNFRDSATSAELDALGRKLNIRNPDGTWNFFGRTLAGKVSSFTDERGSVTSYTYSGDSISSIALPDGSFTATRFDPVYNLPVWNRSYSGGVTEYELNAFGDVIQAKDALQGITIYSYGSGEQLGLLESVTRGSAVTRFEYDSNRRLFTSTDPLNVETEHWYDDAGNPTWTMVDGWQAGRTVYSRTNDLIESYDAYDALVGKWSYNSLGQTVTAEDARGMVTRSEYDSRGWLIRVTEGEGSPFARTIRSGYDLAGNLTDSSVPLVYDNFVGPRTGGRTRREYDMMNRITRETEAYNTTDARSTDYAYDVVANTVATTFSQLYDSELGLLGTGAGAKRIRSKTEYDAVGRVFKTTTGITVDGPGRTTTRRYDSGGRLVSVVDPLGIQTKYAYDALDRVVAVTEAANSNLRRTTVTRYDDAGNIKSVTRPDGVATVYEYTLRNQMSKMIEAANTPVQRTTAYEYDIRGNLSLLHSPRAYDNEITPSFQSVTTEYVYDRNNRLKQKTEAQGIDSSTWHPDSASPQLLTHASPVTKYDYTSAGDLETVTDPLSRITKYTYDLFGRLTSTLEQYVDGDYDTGNYWRGTRKNYDAADNLISESMAGRSTDDSNRYREVTNEYEYDQFGRKTKTTEAASAVTGVWNESTNEVDPLGGYESPVHSTRYDARDQVIETTDPNGTKTKYTYTAFGEHQSTVEAFGKSVQRTTSYLYDRGGRQTNVFVTGLVSPELLARGYGATQRNTATEYDALNRVTAVRESATLAKNKTTRFGYDTNDNKIAVLDPIGRRTEYAYDVYDRLVRTTEDAKAPTAALAPGSIPGGTGTGAYTRISTAGYDAADNLIWEAQPRQYAYQQTGAGPGITEGQAAYVPNLGSPLNRALVTQYEYDALNRKISAAAGANATADDIAALGHPIPVRYWEYDAAGRVKTELSPGRAESGSNANEMHAVQYSYAGVGFQSDSPLLATEGIFVTGVGYGFTGMRSTAMQYDGYGNVISSTSGLVVPGQGGIVGVQHEQIEARQYDPLGRLIRTRTRLNKEANPSLPNYLETYFRYDPVGNLRAQVQQRAGETDPNSIRSTEYQYDELNRVKAKTDASAFAAADFAQGHQPSRDVSAADTLASLGHASPVTTYQYDAFDNAAMVVDASGGLTLSKFDGFGLLRSQTSGDTVTPGTLQSSQLNTPILTTAYDYDLAGRIIETTRTDRGSTGNGQPSTRVSKYTHDPLDRVVSVLDAPGTAELVNADQRKTTTEYDTLDNPLTVVRGVTPTGNRTAGTFVYAYAAPVTTRSEYDLLGRLRTREVVGASASDFTATGRPLESFGYNASGRVVRVVSESGTPAVPRQSVTVTNYDALNRVIAAIEGAHTGTGFVNLDARITTLQYDSADNIVSKVDGNGNRTQTKIRDEAYGTVTESGPDGDVFTTMSYLNAFGQTVSVSNVLNGSSDTIWYDRLGRVKKVDHYSSGDVSVLKGFTETTYSLANRTTTTKESVRASWYGSDGKTVTTMQGDEWKATQTSLAMGTTGAVVETKDAYGASTQTFYNGFGQVDRVVDRNNDSVYYRYDNLGRVSNEVWVKGGVIDRWLVYRYNSNDQLMVATEIEIPATHITLTMLRDHTALPDPTNLIPVLKSAICNTYDAAGRLKTTMNGFGIELTYLYDAAGRVVRVSDNQGGVTTSVYDTAGRLVGRELIVNGISQVKAVFEYKARADTIGRTDLLEQAYEGKPGTDPADRRVQLTVGYDGSGRETSRVWATMGGNKYENLTTEYWRQGQTNDGAVQGLVHVEQRSTENAAPFNTTREVHYLYAPGGQLKEFVSLVNGQSGPGKQFKYDRNGNSPYPNRALALQTERPRVLAQGVEVTGLGISGYDAEGNIVKLLDQNGRQLNDPIDWWYYTYDNRNRLTQVETSEKGVGPFYTSRFMYDPMNRMLEWQAKAAADAGYSLFERNTYDGNQLYARLSADNQIVSRIVYGPDGQLIARTVGTEVRYYLTDRQNSVLQVLDSTGAPYKRIEYTNTDVSSRVWVAGATEADKDAENLEMGGQPFYRSDLFLQRYGDRWMMPKVGRFLTESGSGVRPYVFAENSVPNEELEKPKAAEGPTGHETAKGIAEFLWDNKHFSLGAVGIGLTLWDMAGSPASATERKTEASKFGAGLWDIGYGMTGGLVEMSAWRNNDDGQINWWKTALGPATGGLSSLYFAAFDDSVHTKIVKETSETYNDLRKTGLSQLDAAFVVAMNDAPILSSVTRFAEMWEGHTLHPRNPYQKLTAADYGLNMVKTALDLLPFTKGLGRTGAASGARWLAKHGYKEAALSVVKATQVATRLDRAVSFGVHEGVGGLFGKQSMVYRASKSMAEMAGFKACFAADTPMRTPTGHVMCQDVRVNDLLLSRDEFNPNGLVVAQQVEEVFVREALILELKVLGRTIRTTAEHPFHRYEAGWVACHELKVGDRIALEDGWAEVEGLVDTGSWETVYNFRIADFHTYFVGCDEWGFSVWAHNTECGGAARLTKEQRLVEARKWSDAANQRAIHPDLPEPTSFSALTKKQKELVRKSAREEGMLADDAVVLHGNSPTKAPGVQYELRRLDADQARQAAGFKDWDGGSVAKIGETTYFRDVGGRVVQERYTSEQLRGLQFVVTRRGPQTAMREAEAASIASYVERFGHPPELNIAAATGKGYR